MSYIPDCRADENYNDKYLNDTDAEFIAGFDWCRIMAVENYFDNMDIYQGELDNVYAENEEEEACLEFIKEHQDTLEEIAKLVLLHTIENYIEMQRDELITSMIDNMNEEEYANIKVEVDAGKRKNCIQTYAFEKEDREEDPEV